MVAFVIPWLVLSPHRQRPERWRVAFATGIASVFGTLFGGVIVGRGERRTALISDALSLVTVLALVVAQSFVLPATPSVDRRVAPDVLFDGARLRGGALLYPLAGVRPFLGSRVLVVLVAVLGVAKSFPRLSFAVD